MVMYIPEQDSFLESNSVLNQSFTNSFTVDISTLDESGNLKLETSPIQITDELVLYYYE